MLEHVGPCRYPWRMSQREAPQSICRREVNTISGRVGTVGSEYGFGNHEARVLLLVIGVVLAVALGALLLVVGPAADTVTLLPGFTQAQVATSLQGPTNMAFAPEGRIFVTEQNGALRVVEENTQGTTGFSPSPS